MPLYDYRCPHRHRFEKQASIAAGAWQDCPVCGQASGKVPSRISLGGQASAGLAQEQMPQTWRGTYEGNPEYLGQLRKRWEARSKLEDKHEELRGDQRPVLAHEGPYHAAPLRAGDPAPTPRAGDPAPTPPPRSAPAPRAHDPAPPPKPTSHSH